MRIKRRQVYAIRDAIHAVEKTIHGSNQLAEWERDLAATACCALWDVDWVKLLSCLRRLSGGAHERRAAWGEVLSLATEAVKPVQCLIAA